MNHAGNKPNKRRKYQLSGAAKRKNRRILSQGIPLKEALRRAIYPIGKKPNGKREPKLVIVPPIKIKQTQFHPRGPGGETLQTYQEPSTSQQGLLSKKGFLRQAAREIKVGIIPENFPRDLLTTEQQQAIQEEILEHIINIKQKTRNPVFCSEKNRAGWLSLTCANEETVLWLKNTVKVLRPWNGAKFRLVRGGELPDPCVMYLDVPGSENYPNEKIFKLIEGQNEGLVTANWRVLGRKQRNIAEKPIVELIISVDDQSLFLLQRMGFTLNYRFSQIQLIPKSTKRNIVQSKCGSREKLDYIEPEHSFGRSPLFHMNRSRNISPDKRNPYQTIEEREFDINGRFPLDYVKPQTNFDISMFNMNTSRPARSRSTSPAQNHNQTSFEETNFETRKSRLCLRFSPPQTNFGRSSVVNSARAGKSRDDFSDRNTLKTHSYELLSFEERKSRVHLDIQRSAKVRNTSPNRHHHHQFEKREPAIKENRAHSDYASFERSSLFNRDRSRRGRARNPSTEGRSMKYSFEERDRGSRESGYWTMSPRRHSRGSRTGSGSRWSKGEYNYSV